MDGRSKTRQASTLLKDGQIRPSSRNSPGCKAKNTTTAKRIIELVRNHYPFFFLFFFSFCGLFCFFTVSTPSLPTQVEIIGGFAPRTRSTIGQTQPGRN